MLAGVALSSAIAVAVFFSGANAHGYLEQPKPSWKDSPNPGWITMVDNYWDIGSGGDQVGKFKTMAKEKGMSVKDVVLDMVKDQKCGNTLEDASPQPIPSDGKVKWLGNGGGGFTHTGPCEIYIDDKMVLHGDDCKDEFQGGDVGSKQTSDMPVDFSSCNGKCTLTIYWLAFQNAQWQTYVNCVPLEGSGGSTPTTQGSSTGTESSKEFSTEQQTPTTQGSSTGNESSKDSAEQQTTDAPSTETQSTEGSSTGGQTPETPAA